MFWETGDRSRQELSQNSKVIDLFLQMGAGRSLLILGEPGSGKTIALLKLAERFIEKADSDPSLPIPVVFNLSSWVIKRQPITEWLVVELKQKYQVFRLFIYLCTN